MSSMLELSAFSWARYMPQEGLFWALVVTSPLITELGIVDALLGFCALARGAAADWAAAAERLGERRGCPSRVGGVDRRAGRDDLVERVERVVVQFDGRPSENVGQLVHRARADDR